MDRTVIITGGSGGLGRAVVAEFVADGWRVVVFDLAVSELEGAEVVAVDLTDAEAVGRAVGAAAGDGAPLRAVVNLVGGFAADQPVADTPVEVFEAQFRLNLRPTYLVTQAALPLLAAAGGGSVVCFSSRAAVAPFAGAAGYVAANAAVLAFSRVVALEGIAGGVRCNAVLPRLMDTPANRAAGSEGGTAPERVAEVVAWLCGDGSAAVTGAEIPV